MSIGPETDREPAVPLASLKHITEYLSYVTRFLAALGEIPRVRSARNVVGQLCCESRTLCKNLKLFRYFLYLSFGFRELYYGSCPYKLAV